MQWSADQSTWNTISQVTENTYYDIPANTFPSGNVYWRVQTYNEYDELSGYSDIGTFYSIGAPSAPTVYNITTNISKPTISWTASSQEAYQVQLYKDDILIFDSGSIVQKVYSHKVNTFCSDGEYIAKVCVQNEYGLWSSYAEMPFSIITVKPSIPNVVIQLCKNGVEANVISVEGSNEIILMRADNDSDNYIEISKGTLTDTVLYDYSCVNGKEYKYKVRSISISETFEDSNVILITPVVSNNIFAPVSDLSEMRELTYNLDKQPEKSLRLNPVTSIFYCAGRKFAIYDKSEHMESNRGFTFCIRTYEELESFIYLFNLGDTVLWRDSTGRKMYGIITNLSIVDTNNVYQVSFSLNEVDFQEGVLA